MKASTIQNRFLFIVSMIIMGAIAGAVVWAFLFIMEWGIVLIWDVLPSYFNFVFFPLIICIIGGLVIGFHHKFLGDYPESLDTVLEKVKEDKRYEYKHIASYSSAALLPLIFGASVGPEAGLTGTIAGLCTWVGDRMKRFGSDFKSMTEIGVAAALSAIFTAPLFGFVAPMFGSTSGNLGNSNKSRNGTSHAKDDLGQTNQSDTESSDRNNIDGALGVAEHDNSEEEVTFTLPKNWKIVVYLCAIAGAMGIFFLLQTLTGSGGGLPHFSEIEYGLTELLWTLPIIFVGAVAGWLYHIFDGVALAINEKLGERPVIKALLGGIVLGLCGIAFPYTMFSGESQITEVIEIWTGLGAVFLFLTGFIKLFTTSFCIRSGWKGGHFFPAIFSGVSIGLGFAALSGADPVFCMCACAGALVGCLTKQPILTVLLLFLCFPIKGVVIMIVAASVGSAMPIPKRFQQKLN